jgi:hypothetical protein
MDIVFETRDIMNKETGKNLGYKLCKHTWNCYSAISFVNTDRYHMHDVRAIWHAPLSSTSDWSRAALLQSVPQRKQCVSTTIIKRLMHFTKITPDIFRNPSLYFVLKKEAVCPTETLVPAHKSNGATTSTASLPPEPQTLNSVTAVSRSSPQSL